MTKTQIFTASSIYNRKKLHSGQESAGQFLAIDGTTAKEESGSSA